jgi:nitroimidazol reductase NimA-like FMN-containing flavoprotein (pyridoxamine 5'-phosphate oxidase superfamily)
MAEIESIISGCDVCRIAFADNNVPYIVTMNFGYSNSDKPCFYFHCAPAGRKIDLISVNNYVCFELDTDHVLTEAEAGCDWGMKFSSVVGYGRLSIVTDPEERILGLDRIMFHYSGKKGFTYDSKVLSATKILRLDIEEITAKRKK